MQRTLQLERWRSLMNRLGAPEHRRQFEELCAAYSEPQRHYHTVEHISNCLHWLDRAVHLAGCAGEVEAALWFHDAVYDPKGQSNERRSADWAREFLEAAGVTEASCGRIHQHIMATEHDAAPADADSALVVDIDLAILGSPASEYAAFERNVRLEYQWVPKPLFRSRRRQILSSFLARPSIYSTEFFRNHLERTARTNLQGAVNALR